MGTSGTWKRAVAFALLACLGWSVPALAVLQPGDLAPNFTLSRWDPVQENWDPGNPVNLRDFAGQIVVLSFFNYDAVAAPQCPTASQELQLYVQQHYENQGGNPADIPVQVISLSINGNNQAAMQDFVSQYGLDLVADDSNQSTYSAYSTENVPNIQVINGVAGANYTQWQIVNRKIGYAYGDYTSIRTWIDGVTLVNPSRDWIGGASSANEWAAVDSWSPAGVPDQAGAKVTFGNAGASNTVKLDAARTVGSITFNADVGTTVGLSSLSSGGRLILDNNGARAAVKATGSHTVQVPITLSSDTDITVNGTSSTLTINEQIGGTKALAKLGDGKLTLLLTNTYTGKTTISNGMLSIRGASALGNSSPSAAGLELNGGTLQFFGAAASTETNRLFTLGTAGGTLNASGTGGPLAFSGAGSIAFSGSGSRTLTLAGSSAAANTFTPILGNGPGGTTSLEKRDTGVWVLAGAQTYTGTTSVLGGTLRLGGNERIANTSPLIVNGGIFDLLAYNETVGTVTLSSGSIVGGQGRLTGPSYNVQGGALRANLGGTAVLTKSGPGIAYLGGDNLYSGGTTVSGGQLVIESPEALPPGRRLTIGAGATVVLGAGIQWGAEVVPNAGGAQAAAIPEPATLSLLAAGAAVALGWVLSGRRHRRSA